MRLLVVADQYFGDHASGLPRVAWDVARLMARDGHAVHFVCMRLSDTSFSPFSEKIGGITVHRVFRPALPPWHPGRCRIPVQALAREVRKVASAVKFDAVHYHSIFTGTAVHNALSSPPRTIFTVHSPVAREQQITWRTQGLVGRVNQLIGTPIVRLMEKRLLKKADKCQTLSAFTATALREQHPSIRREYEIIPHWVRPDWHRTLPKSEARKALGWPDDCPILFTVRGLRPRYGLPDAIEAIAPLVRTGAGRFFIAGDGPNREGLSEQIKHAGATASIRLLGGISDDTLKLAYQAADLFILPTRELECFGLVAVEALAYGLPVVGTTVGAIPEILWPILPDFLVPPFSPQALRDVVQKFLNGSLSAPRSGELIDYARSHYSEDRARVLYGQLYGIS
jgi:glycosyltransferase involved in cell wall biosynthesis